jgi:hypothetical protein
MTLPYLEIDLHNTMVNYKGQSQLPCSMRHEMSSPAETLGSWVRIPLETWTSVRVSSVFALPCIGTGFVSGADYLSK